MSSARTVTWRARLARTTRVLAGLLILSVLAFLPFAGRYLVAEDPLQHADAIVVLAGARVERWLEGYDLYRAAWAPRILLSNGKTEPAERRLREMGIAFPREGELARDALIRLGVPRDVVDVFGVSVDNTAQEASAGREAARAGGWHRIILVTSKYHTRRAGFAFRREFRGTGVEIVVRGSRYDPFVADRWWTDRASLRDVLSELQRLAVYRLGLGG